MRLPRLVSPLALGSHPDPCHQGGHGRYLWPRPTIARNARIALSWQSDKSAWSDLNRRRAAHKTAALTTELQASETVPASVPRGRFELPTFRLKGGCSSR
jgi:hypothetical protein